MPCDLIPPTFRFEKSFRINIPKREEWSSSPHLFTDNALPWYTDGSLTHLAGASFHCPQNQRNESIPLGAYAGVFQAETTGIIRCCSEITDNSLFEQPIHIFIDSQAAIKALAKNRFTSALTLECRDALDSLSSKSQVTLIWVPGHRGIEGNEAADGLARLASSTPLAGPEPGIPVSLSTLNMIISEWKKDQFKKGWKEITIARQAKHCITISAMNSKFFLSQSRKNLKRLTDILTGHCSLNNHLNIMGINDSPNCEKCGDAETAEHFLCTCPAYMNNRRRLLGNYAIKYSSIWSIHPKHILKFLNASGRY